MFFDQTVYCYSDSVYNCVFVIKLSTVTPRVCDSVFVIKPSIVTSRLFMVVFL